MFFKSMRIMTDGRTESYRSILGD